MYATRTTFAATTAVMAAKVELPMNASRSGLRREVQGEGGPHQGLARRWEQVHFQDGFYAMPRMPWLWRHLCIMLWVQPE